MPVCFCVCVAAFTFMLQKLSSLYGPESLECLLAGLLEQQFADPYSGGLVVTWKDKSTPLH